MSPGYASIDGHQNAPYDQGGFAASQGHIAPASGPARKGLSPWVKFGIPVALLIIAGAVVGGVVGTRHHSSSAAAAAASSSAATAPPSDPSAAASSAVDNKVKIGVFPTATNSYYMMPVYPSTTNAALFISPTFVPTTDAKVSWPSDPHSFSNSPSPTTVRPDHPRLIAPSYKWAALPQLIANDPYLKSWNDTIFGNATTYYNAGNVSYFMDGDSGILDNAREVKQRMKAWGYAYRMTNNTKWADRAMTELQNTATFGQDPDRWNSAHFLDTAELTAAFGIAYDWMYDAWTDDNKGWIRDTMIKYGMSFGIKGFTDSSVYTGWWKNVGIYGNWNCVCNGGLTLGALAILGDDTTGTAEQILGLTVPNAKLNCVWAPSSDGTWAETPNYWYFGTTGHAEMTAALLSAAGDDFGLLKTNPNFYLTGLYHMHSAGPTSQFNWGDHGPNKYTATANSMLLYGQQYNMPAYTLFQRDQADAADPWSMFWYDPTVAGAFWENMPLDHFFTNATDTWAAMRSSWTDNGALYVGIKAPALLNHQTHGDLDAGDFVLDALGYRWAGEFGSANYRSKNYFSNENQDSDRWLYYRKRTEGQNCIVVGNQNQNVQAQPKLLANGTTGEAQGPTTVYTPPKSSTAFFVADLASAYFNVTSYERGIRTLNGRKQVLLQDEINASASLVWMMHTNATVTVDSADGTKATLTLFGQTLNMQVLNAPAGAAFTTMTPAARNPDDPPVPSGDPAENADQPNPGVTTVMIALDAGTYTLQVLFSPQWPGMASADFVTPPNVALGQWSLTSHN